MLWQLFALLVSGKAIRKRKVRRPPREGETTYEVIYKCAGLEAKGMPGHQHLFGKYWQMEWMNENLETSPDRIPMAKKWGRGLQQVLTHNTEPYSTG